ncbi:hypothetical protein FB451DRAFT_304891 [Mycena latifolia]|nr:hypothetical protein FB451DRAFT_304891 [Mycena latifolia]
MAYPNPYASPYGDSQQRHRQPQYGQQQYGAGSYAYGQHDAASEFNPYTPREQPGRSYEHAYGKDSEGYREDPVSEHEYPLLRGGSQHRLTSSLYSEEFTPILRGPKTASNLRKYRMEHQGDLWMKGGRARCCCRFFCCTFMILIFLVVTILLTIILWLRPPSLAFTDVGPPPSGPTVQTTSDGITLNLGVNISVNNPNFFGVSFKAITADIFYPLNKTAIGTPIGNGTIKDVVLASNAQTNFTFPFSVDYSLSLDPNVKILADIAGRCGFLNDKETSLSVNYKITLRLQILFMTISPSISNAFSFACPLSADDVSGLLKNAGLIPSSRGEEIFRSSDDDS